MFHSLRVNGRKELQKELGDAKMGATLQELSIWADALVVGERGLVLGDGLFICLFIYYGIWNNLKAQRNCRGDGYMIHLNKVKGNTRDMEHI